MFMRSLIVSAMAVFAVDCGTQAQAANCSGVVGKVTAVSTDRMVRPSANYAGDRRLAPVLSAKVVLDKPVTCVVVHVSAYIHPADNHAAFQVTIDGAPMAGHAATFPGTNYTFRQYQSLFTICPNGCGAWLRK